jgi:hypothetical protein
MVTIVLGEHVAIIICPEDGRGDFSEMLVTAYKMTHYHNPEYHRLSAPLTHQLLRV